VIRIKIDSECTCSGMRYTPLTSKYQGQWYGGFHLTLDELEEYGQFLVDFVSNKRAIEQAE
jgi:hypothetical protein